jgi:hypothetical protein
MVGTGDLDTARTFGRAELNSRFGIKRKIRLALLQNSS